MKKNISLQSVNQTQTSSIESLEQHFRTALTLANQLYLKIPQGTWRKFFDETLEFNRGLTTEPSLVFLYQDNRIRAIKKLNCQNSVIELFLKRNFNKLVEVLLYPFYEKCMTEPIAVDHRVSIEIPPDFVCDKKTIAQLQDAFHGELIIAKKLKPSSDREMQQGNSVFFEFSFCMQS